MTMSETPDLPDCRQLMLPLLKIAAGGETNLRRAVERLSVELGLDAAQRAAMQPGGRQTIIDHRAYWARTHMMRAGLIERCRPGTFRATARGRELLAGGIDDLGLVGWGTARGSAPTRGQNRSSAVPSPLWRLAHAATPRPAIFPRSYGRSPTLQVSESDADLARALIDRILAMPGRSAFFEDVALHLLTTIGYGNGLDGAATRTAHNLSMLRRKAQLEALAPRVHCRMHLGAKFV
jgi:restriction system protein